MVRYVSMTLIKIKYALYVFVNKIIFKSVFKVSKYTYVRTTKINWSSSLRGTEKQTVYSQKNN